MVTFDESPHDGQAQPLPFDLAVDVQAVKDLEDTRLVLARDPDTVVLDAAGGSVNRSLAMGFANVMESTGAANEES